MSDLAQIFGGAVFDPNSVEPAQDFEAIPPGKYPVLIDKAEVKQTKAGTGHYIEVTMSVLDGQFKGRKVWDRINIQNPNQQAVEIGMRSLSALALAIGLQAVANTDQLVNRACIAHVKVKDGSNEVRTYSALQQPPQAPVTQTTAPTQPTPQYVTPAQQAYAQPPQQQYAPPPQQQYAPPPQPAATTGKPPWAR